MSYLQHQEAASSHTHDDAQSASLSEFGDTATFGSNDPTVDCYNRRSQILTDANKAEWWVAIAVLLLIIGMGFVAI